jgi:Tfp pilus assembly protein PilX
LAARLFGEQGGEEGTSLVITFVLLGIIALFVLAGLVTVNDGLHGRL